MARRPAAAVLAAYTAISFLYFGARLLRHFGDWYVGVGADPQIFIWALAWWPHAILHGENPFVTDAIWAPDGMNLAWVVSMPGLAVAVAPLTLTAGPVIAYNVAAIAMPALAGWTAFLLCRRVTGRTWPAAVGGYLFGFSPYMLGQQFGHLHMTTVFLLPLVALVVLRWLDGALGDRALALLLGVIVAAQLYLSTEVALTLTLALAAGLVLGYVTAPRRRARLRRIVVPVAGGYGVAALLASPLLVYALLHFESESINAPAGYPADLANFVVPTNLVAVSTGWADTLSTHFPGNAAEQGAYLGIPVLLIVVLHAIRTHRAAGTRFLVAALAVAGFAALGPALWIGGHRIVRLPWTVIDSLPALNNVLPVRLSVFVVLAAAVLVARWLADARTPAWLRGALAVLAVVSVLPNPHVSWHVTPERPAYFTERGYETSLRPDDIVVVLPYGPNGHSMLWQAESDFAFRMAGGYVRPFDPPSFLQFRIVHAFESNDPTATPDDLRALARAKGVTAVVVERDRAEFWRPILGAFEPPLGVDDVLIYRLAEP